MLSIPHIMLLLFVLFVGFGLPGCASTAHPSRDQLDATGLKYVAADRAGKRLAQEQAQPPELDGFTQKLDLRDGKVRLTLEEAVRRTLKNSLDLQVASYTPAISETDILAAESVFDAVYFLKGSLAKTDTPSSNFLLSGGEPAVVQDERPVSTGIRKTFATGGSLTVSENLDYMKSNNPFALSPSYATNVMMELSQPLLRNLGLDANKAQIYIASYGHEATIEDFRKKVMDVILNLESTYWDLVFAVRDVEVRQGSLALAEEVYRKEQRREEQKMAKKLEVSRARAAVTSRRAELIRAQNLVRDISDKLKNIMNDPQLPLTDETLRIVPADEPKLLRPAVDYRSAVIAAVDERPELRRLRQEIHANEVQNRYYWNQLLPKLDLSFAWRRNALGQDSGDAFKDQGTGRFTDYITGLSGEVPLGNRLAESHYRKSKLSYEQSLKNLEKVTEDIVLEVNTAIREQETNLEEISATRDARMAAKDTVDGEEARYEVGDVTNEELLRAQRDLEEAARNEVQAITRFNVSLVRLERAKGTLLDYNNIHVLPKDFQDQARNARKKNPTGSAATSLDLPPTTSNPTPAATGNKEQG